jgi:hypothetical protein
LSGINNSNNQNINLLKGKKNNGKNKEGLSAGLERVVS